MDAIIPHIYANEDETEAQKQLQDLNNCRTHLGITTLLDCVSLDGKYILQEVSLCRLPPHTHVSRWSKAYPLTRNQRERWQTVLKDVFCTPHSTTRKLRRPLGHWLNKTQPSWIWWYHQPTRTVYQCTANHQWYAWEHSHRQNYRNPTAVNKEEVPSTIVRATCAT